MTLVELPPGRFTMGSASSERGRNDDEVLHEVEITRPFLLGRYEVTQQEWRTVMGTSPSRFASCGLRCPVENVSFADVQQFLAKLNAHAAAPGSTAPALQFRLPTEAEWDTGAARIPPVRSPPARTSRPLRRTTTEEYPYAPFAAGPAGEFRQKPTPVGTFPQNPFGLADMHGNVWEWTSDWYGPYGDTAVANIDPHGAPGGEKRVIRGGSWLFDANSARCGLRYTHAPQDRGYSLGLSRELASRVAEH